MIAAHPVGQNIVDSGVFDESVASAGEFGWAALPEKSGRWPRWNRHGLASLHAADGNGACDIYREIALAPLQPLLEEDAHFRVTRRIRSLQRAVDDIEKCVLVRSGMVPQNVVRALVVTVILQPDQVVQTHVIQVELEVWELLSWTSKKTADWTGGTRKGPLMVLDGLT